MLLTKQEKNIAELIAFGFSEKEMATKLFIAESTVHTHAKNIRKKIAARSAVDVARYFILENPQKFFLAMLFLIIQGFMVISAESFEMRKTRTVNRVVKVRKNEA